MKVPSGQETYLFPTIDVGPNVAYQGNDPQDAGEYGLEPGAPLADSGNRTRESLGVRGSLEEASRDLLPITITVEGKAAFEASVRGLVDAASQTGTDIRIEDLIRQVARGQRIARSSAVSVPRFGVTYDDNQGVRGVDVDFRPDIGLATGGELSAPASHAFYPVSAPASGYTRVIGPALITDSRGRVWCFALVQRDHDLSADQDKCAIRGWRYDQSVDTGWQLVVEIDDLYNTSVSPTSSYVGSVALTFPTIAACLHRGEVIVFVMDAGASGVGGVTHPSALHVYRLQEAADNSASLHYVAGPVAINRGYGVVADGGIAACSLSDRVVVAIGGNIEADLYLAGIARAIWIGSSTDLVTWSDQSDNTNGFVVLDDFVSVLPAESDGSDIDQTVNDIAFLQPDGLYGWAVCQSGRIYHTTNGGQSWVRQDSPVTTPLYALSVISSGSGTNPDAIAVVAVGASGAVLRTLDSGTTWQVVSISSSAAADIDNDRFTNPNDAAYRSRKTVGDQTFYDCVFVPGTGLGWVVGENAVVNVDDVLDTNQAGTWRPIMPKETTGTFTSVVIVDSTEDNTILLVGGIIQRQRNKAGDKDTGEYRFMRIAHARLTPPSYSGGDYTFTAPTDDDSAGMRIEAMAQYAPPPDASAVRVYACGRGGQALTTINGGVTWSAISKPVPTTQDLVDIFFRRGGSESQHEIIVLAANGLLYRTRTSAGNAWLAQHVGTEIAGQVITAPQTGFLSTIADEDEGILLVGGAKSCWRTDLTARQQALPSLVAISGAEAVLATADLAQGRVDLRRTLDRGQTWSSINVDGAAQITFPKQDPIDADPSSPGYGGSPPFPNNAYIKNTSKRPSACLTEDGRLIVTGGDTGIVSPDGRGEQWLPYNASQLALPLGVMVGPWDGTLNVSRQTVAFGGGRLLTAYQTGTPSIHTRTAYEWTTAATTFMPVQAGLAQWVGLDDLRVVFQAADLPVGETWTIPAVFRYAASHLVLPWRSHYWRGPTSVAQALTMIWDAGVGQQFHVDGAALIGANFRLAKLALSIPSYLTTKDLTDASGWGTFLDPANWTEFTLQADVDTGVTTAVSDGSSLGYNVLVSNGKTWLPHQWQALYRQYYVLVHDTTPVVFRILDNATDHLLIDNAGTTIPTGIPFTIFTDRAYTDGSGGLRGSTVFAPTIADTLYAFGRYLRLTIPVQPTADGYFKLDALLAGTQVRLNVETPTGVLGRDGRTQGWSVSTLWSSQEDGGLDAGVVSTTVFGSAIRQWSLSHGPRYEEDVATIFQPLVGRMRRGFCLVFDHLNPVDTIEYVRLINDTLDAQHAGGTLLSSPALTVREVR